MTVTRTIASDDKTDWVLSTALWQSRNDWEKSIDSLLDGRNDLSSFSDIASSYAVLFAELSAYFDARGANGCGDSGHDAAMKEVAQMRKRVRKALGYSYP